MTILGGLICGLIFVFISRGVPKIPSSVVTTTDRSVNYSFDGYKISNAPGTCLELGLLPHGTSSRGFPLIDFKEFSNGCSSYEKSFIISTVLDFALGLIVGGLLVYVLEGVRKE